MESDEPQEIQALRKALSFSPDNTALIKHLCDVLIKFGRFESAERELKGALEIEPSDSEAAMKLAHVYLQLEKLSEALVILENLEEKSELTAEGLLTFAKLLSNTTELVKAAEYYKKAKEQDPNLEDEFLETELAPFLIEYAGDDPSDPRKAHAGNVKGSFEVDREQPKIDFSHIGGMEGVKEQVRMKIIHPLANAELFKAYGKKIGGGVLLYGPPGCGKTLLARATAGEVKANFYSLGLHEVLSMWIGESEKNLHETFQQARSSAPAVLFFDEVDALAAKRSDMRQSGGRHVINQFLSELDGAEHSNDGVLILAATNAPWHLDTAFRRPGRFDNIIFVPPPDQEAREAILRVMLKDKPSEGIDYASLAQKSDGFTGADMKAAVDRAIETKLEKAMKTGNIEPMSNKDLLKAIKKQKPSSKEWFATAKNHALFANQAGHYDEILEYLNIKK